MLRFRRTVEGQIGEDAVDRRGGWGWHLLELVPLVLLVAAARVLPVMPAALQGVSGFKGADHPGLFGVGFPVGQAVLSELCLVLVIILSWFRLSRKAFYALALLAFAVPYGIVYHFFVGPELRHIQEGFLSIPALLRPQHLVPLIAMNLRFALLILCPLMSALYFVRLGFSWTKYLLGWALCLVGLYVVLFHSVPFEFNTRLLWAVIVNLACTVVPVLLPAQRKSLERLTGFSLSSGPALPPPEITWTSRLADRCTLLLVTGLLIYFSVINGPEYRALRIFVNGPVLELIVPGAVNANDYLKDVFTRLVPPSPAQKNWTTQLIDKLPPSTRPFIEETGPMPAELLQQLFAMADKKAVSQYLDSMGSAMSDLEQAAAADYFRYNEREQTTAPVFLDWKALRNQVSAVATRARMHLLDRNTSEALSDTELILRFSYVVDTDSGAPLVHHLVAAAIRKIGLSTARNCLLQFRGKAPEMEQLREMLARNASRVRVAFPAEMQRNEPAFWPIVPYAEVWITNVPYAYWNFYQKWEEYDALLLATAVECYRNDNGKLPASLDQLVPRYIARLPKDPLHAQPYLYEIAGDTYSVKSSHDPVSDLKKQAIEPPQWAQIRRTELPLSQEEAKEAAAKVEKVRLANGTAGR